MATKARLDSIDFWRGIVLCTIFIDHLPGNLFESLTPRNYGFSDAAEAFVFLSGVSLALAYGTRFESGDKGPILQALARRCLKLYGVHIGLSLLAIAIFAAGAAWGHDPALLTAHGRDLIINEPVEGTLGLILLGHQIGYFNILPLYLVLMAFVPLLLWLATIDRRLMLAFSLTLYLATRLGQWNLPSWPLPGVWFFDPLAWQLVMAIGLAIGLGVKAGDTIPRSRPLIAIAGTIVLFGAVVVTNGLGLWPGLRDSVQNWADLDKMHLGVGRVVHFIALAYLVYALRWAQALHAWRGYSLLALLGRNSLWVFALVSILTAIGQVLMESLRHTAVFDLMFIVGGLVAIYAATSLIDVKPGAILPRRQTEPGLPA